jgi:hypothetical protein
MESLMATLGFGGDEEEEAAAAEGEIIEIHESFDIEEHDHTLANQPGTNNLVFASDSPTLLDQHPDEDVRDAYPTYLAEVAAATSPTSRKEAADRNARIIIQKIKAAGDAETPRASAPGLGDIEPHTMQQSKLRRGGIRVWWLESEHVIPRAMVEQSFFAMAQTGVPAAGPDYNRMRTLLIYKGAAEVKTRGEFGDLSTINDFKATMRELVEAVLDSPSDHVDRAREAMPGAVRRMLDAFAQDAEERTNLAIQQENQQNGAARGPEDSPEPASPPQGRVHAAFLDQSADVRQQLQVRINAFLTERAAKG